MLNSESNKSLQQRENSSSSATKSTTNTARPIIVKKVDSVKRRSKTITSKNNGGNLNLSKQSSNDNQRNRNESCQDKENIQPNFQRDASLKELNALSALKRLSDFNEYDDLQYNKLDETFRGIHGWNTSEDTGSNPVSQRILKEKDNIINKRGNLMKKDKPLSTLMNHNNYPYKNILQNMSNNINTYEKKANQLLNMKDSLIEIEKENAFEKERLLQNNGQVGGFGNIVQDLKKLQEDLSSPQKNNHDQDSSINNGGYVKPLNMNLQKLQIEKKGGLAKQKVELTTSNSQNRYIKGTISLTPQGQANTDYTNIQQLLSKVTSNEKSLKMKFNEDYSINICSNPNNQSITNNPTTVSQGCERNQDERITACSQHTNNTYLNTSSSTQEIENIQGQLNQPYLRSRIESYSHVVDEISKRKKNQVIRVADTERYDKSFVQYPIQLKNPNNSQPDVLNASISEAVPSQNSNHTEKIQSPILSSYLIKKKIENNQPESENRRSKSINGVSNNQNHFLSYQNTISNQNNLNQIMNSSSNNSTNNTTLYGTNQVQQQQSQIQKISKSISIGKNNGNFATLIEKEKENLSMQQSKTNVTGTPNSAQIMLSNKSKDLDVNVRVFPHLSDIQHEKKGLHQRLHDNDLNPYNVAGHGSNIFYQPSHVPLTPHQFSQSLSRNSYNPKFIPHTNSEKSKNESSYQKSFSQNSHSLITQNSVSLEKRQIPSSLIIYTNHNSGSNSNGQFPNSSSQAIQQQPISSQNLFNVLQKRIQQGSLSINSTITQQTLQIGNNPQIQAQANGPSRNNSSNKLVLPPKPQSNNLNATSNAQQSQNKSKLPKLFKNSNRTFLKKMNSRNDEIKGLQIQAQKAISNSFL